MAGSTFAHLEILRFAQDDGAFASLRMTAAFLLLSLALLPTASAQEVRAEEKITVERIVIDVRVTDAKGDAIASIVPADFRVRVDNRKAEVESVEWIPETAGARELHDLDRREGNVGEMKTPAPEGRLLIFFFQTDFARATSRVGGEMKVMPFADQLIEWLQPEDRVAVLSFDSHLKFRTDFTNDRELLRKVIRDSLKTDDPGWPPIVHSPALRSFLKADEALAAASSERALLLLGNALLQIPGPKSLILFGWGLGRLSSSGVSMTRDYGPARRALERSRTSAFVLDTSDADYHSLEVGLAKAAEDTGGFYAKTNHFPQLAIERVQRALEGHYELVLRKPAGVGNGRHDLLVELVGKDRSWHVMAPLAYEDRQ